MQRCSILMIAAGILSACKPSNSPFKLNTPADPDAVELQTYVSTVAKPIGTDFGADSPVGPSDFKSSAEWEIWARTEWPKACAQLQIRTANGRVAKAGRQCKVEAVIGIVPTASVVTTGILTTLQGEEIAVGWGWTDHFVGGTEKNSCDTDPVDDGAHVYRLTRSRSNQAWKLYRQIEPNKPPLADDSVREVCSDLERFHRR